jgi:hypothetical protein
VQLIFKIIREYIWQPEKWWRIAFLGFWRPLRTRFRVRLKGLYHPSYYPREIHKKYLQIRFDQAANPENIAAWQISSSRAETRQQAEFIINCAGTRLPVSGLPDFWRNGIASVQDPEVIHSSHRFHWLAEKLAQGASDADRQVMLEMVKRWQQAFQEAQTGSAWQPYTVAERLCNWILLWQSLEPQECDPEFADSWLKAIQAQAVFLSGMLEYPASGIINNHILNNARALYIAGRFLGNQGIAELGRAILQRHLPDMVGDGGFLLEASSHYHLLLTRSIAEVLQVAQQTGDKTFAQWLDDFAVRMFIAARKIVPAGLHQLGDMPRIGDVSPDVPFDWFSPWPEKLPAGWNKLWNEIRLNTTGVPVGHDGWLAMQRDQWFALSYAHPSTDAYPAGHGHDDFGSFCLYFRGRPVAIDIGRLDYQVGNQHLAGISAEQHNTVIIDQDSLLPAGTGLASMLSASARRAAKCSKLEDNQGVSWSAISQSGAIWERRLLLESATDACLSDHISNAESVHGFIYFAPDARPVLGDNHSLMLSLGDCRMHLAVSGVTQILLEKTAFFPRYGVQLETMRLRWVGEVSERSATIKLRFHLDHSSAGEC